MAESGEVTDAYKRGYTGNSQKQDCRPGFSIAPSRYKRSVIINQIILSLNKNYKSVIFRPRIFMSTCKIGGEQTNDDDTVR